MVETRILGLNLNLLRIPGVLDGVDALPAIQVDVN